MKTAIQFEREYSYTKSALQIAFEARAKFNPLSPQYALLSNAIDSLGDRAWYQSVSPNFLRMHVTLSNRWMQALHVNPADLGLTW